MMSKNMMTRIISGAVLLAITAVCNYFGGLVLLLVLFGASEIGLFEFYRATGILKDNEKVNAVTSIGYLFTAVYYVLLYFRENSELQLFSLIATIVITMGIYVFRFPKLHADTIAYSIFGFVYVGVMISFIYRVRNLEYGIYTVWLIIIVSWLCDTCAYFTGMTIGKHKLAPILSPKKSIEGSIGGIVGSAVFGFLYARFVLDAMLPGCVIPIVIICVVCSAISQIGDLAASAIKRNHNIKDYGTLIPGHGGILDRFDSVIFTAPMIFFLLSFMVHGQI